MVATIVPIFMAILFILKYMLDFKFHMTEIFFIVCNYFF